MNIKKTIALILALGIVLAAVGCTTNKAPVAVEEPAKVEGKAEEIPAETPAEAVEETPSAEGIVVTDQAGREVTVLSADRIVSGYYISTSSLIALDLEDRLVGIEAKADKRPIYKLAAPELLELPNVGTAKEFDMEGCIALEPDLVILPKRLKDEATTLEGLGISVLLVNPESTDELVEMLELIGEVTGTQTKAESIKTIYQDRLSKIEGLTKDITEKPKVYMGSNSSFLATAPKDMYQASLIRLAGGKNVGDALENDSWTEVSYEQILDFNPEIIIIPSGADYTKEDIVADSQLAEVTAVKDGRIYNMPNMIEAWDSPTTSWIMGAGWMLNVLYPEIYTTEELAKDTASFYKEVYGLEEIDTAFLES